MGPGFESLPGHKASEKRKLFFGNLFGSSVGRASRFYREGPGFSRKLSGLPGHKASEKRELFLFMAFVYIIYSEKINKYDVGACIDPERRLYEHHIGHSTFTSTGRPWKLMYQEEFMDLPTAKKREAAIKKMKSGKHIENRNCSWF